MNFEASPYAAGQGNSVHSRHIDVEDEDVVLRLFRFEMVEDIAGFFERNDLEAVRKSLDALD